MEFKLTAIEKDKTIRNAPILVSIMQDILKRDDFPIDQREHFWIVGLDDNYKLNYVELVKLGNHEQVEMTSTDVFRVALIKNSSKVIFVHNHPTGKLLPSQADKHTTLCLIRLAEMVGIKVIDHIIISTDDYFSFADDGLLDEIKLSDEYRLLDRAKYDQLKSDLKQAGKVEAIFQEKILITKKLAELGIAHDLIKKATGLEP